MQLLKKYTLQEKHKDSFECSYRWATNLSRLILVEFVQVLVDKTIFGSITQIIAPFVEYENY